jgi:hypothetical protein
MAAHTVFKNVKQQCDVSLTHIPLQRTFEQKVDRSVYNGKW